MYQYIYIICCLYITDTNDYSNWQQFYNIQYFYTIYFNHCHECYILIHTIIKASSAHLNKYTKLNNCTNRSNTIAKCIYSLHNTIGHHHCTWSESLIRITVPDQIRITGPDQNMTEFYTIALYISWTLVSKINPFV